MAQALQKFNMCDFVASMQASIAKAAIVSEQWCSYIERHGAPLCVVITHVWKPAFAQYNTRILILTDNTSTNENRYALATECPVPKSVSATSLD